MVATVENGERRTARPIEMIELETAGAVNRRAKQPLDGESDRYRQGESLSVESGEWRVERVE